MSKNKLMYKPEPTRDTRPSLGKSNEYITYLWKNQNDLHLKVNGDHLVGVELLTGPGRGTMIPVDRGHNSVALPQGTTSVRLVRQPEGRPLLTGPEIQLPESVNELRLVSKAGNYARMYGMSPERQGRLRHALAGLPAAPQLIVHDEHSRVHPSVLSLMQSEDRILRDDDSSRIVINELGNVEERVLSHLIGKTRRPDNAWYIYDSVRGTLQRSAGPAPSAGDSIPAGAEEGHMAAKKKVAKKGGKGPKGAKIKPPSELEQLRGQLSFQTAAHETERENANHLRGENRRLCGELDKTQRERNNAQQEAAALRAQLADAAVQMARLEGYVARANEDEAMNTGPQVTSTQHPVRQPPGTASSSFAHTAARR